MRPELAVGKAGGLLVEARDRAEIRARLRRRVYVGWLDLGADEVERHRARGCREAVPAALQPLADFARLLAPVGNPHPPRPDTRLAVGGLELVAARRQGVCGLDRPRR